MKPILINDVVSSQAKSSVLRKIIDEVNLKQRMDYKLKDNGTLMTCGRLCVPNNAALKDAILEKAHSSTYNMNLESTKTY